ncbi:MAG TPA: isochorismatase family cysteine hydrolase [Gemmatimonadales bacterium]|jgi:nicotinamidase-related amidase|nr:isochorismatase family cysteine hydrolase [Gemmatimonadales bacterium]
MGFASTALLVMDVQPNIVGRYGSPDDYLTRVAKAVGAARKAGIRVIYVTVSFREGRPEVSTRNKMFASVPPTGFVTGDPSTSVHPAVAPAPGEIQITKRRVSAFAGSDLEVVLRAGNTDTLILCGIATSGVVLSTVRQAADLDYRLVVLSDGCLDQDPEVHRVLTEKVFLRQADVKTVADWSQEVATG